MFNVEPNMSSLDRRRVLVVDDDPFFLNFISSILSVDRNYRVASANIGDNDSQLDPQDAELPTPGLVNETTQRRSDARRRVLKGAKIMLYGLRSTINCTGRDMSDEGARLRVENIVATPNDFALEILTDGIHHEVPTRWQCGDEIGVRFVKELQ